MRAPGVDLYGLVTAVFGLLFFAAELILALRVGLCLGAAALLSRRGALLAGEL